MVICGVHTVRIPESPALRELAAKKELVYAFFTLPYFCKAYKPSILKAKAVVMAYEGTPLAQKYAAQAIFGGIAVKGKLSVSIPTLYTAGTGVFTEKTRLGYHEPEEVEASPRTFGRDRLYRGRRFGTEGVSRLPGARRQRWHDYL